MIPETTSIFRLALCWFFAFGGITSRGAVASRDDFNADGRAAASTLQHWYNHKGLWDTTGWWNAANCVEALENVIVANNGQNYLNVISNTFKLHAEGNFLNDYYDDEGWWALAWIRAYDLTGNPQYLKMAKTIFKDMTGGWSDRCGGGLGWRKSRSSKNAIQNELFLLVAARLHQRTPGDGGAGSYFEWAIKEWDWFKHSGLINSQNLVNDGLNRNCENNGRTTWTYNQGVIIGGLTELYKTTGDSNYANAFYKDENKVSEWKSDFTDMKPGVHERKWEVDSLCYPIRLAYGYWKASKDITPLGAAWRDAISKIVQTFHEQQRKDGKGPYHFMRRTETQTDTVAGRGYGNPGKPVGLICSMFRPSDDATVFPYLVPANFFAVVSLRQAAEMLEQIHHDTVLAGQCRVLADEVEQALQTHAVVNPAKLGRVYAYEVDAYGNYYCIDDGNVPSLLSLPYLGVVKSDDKVYQNTRRLVLSKANPYYCKGKAANGPGGPHVGMDMIWPLGLIVQGLTSTNDQEIRQCLTTLQKTHAGTGFMHEAFHKDDPNKFTRSWFAWANTIFGELVLKTFNERPSLLD